MITEEQLMAYVDGEASEEARAEIDAALAADAGLRSRVADERRLRRRMANLYAPVLTEPVPERLTAVLRKERDNVVAFKPANRPARPWRWPAGAAAAVAASLVVGLLVGQQMGIGRPGAPEGSMLRASGPLAAALQTELASAPSADALVRIGVSFTARDGRPCRTFETAEASGLACRSDGEWRLALMAAAPGGRTSQYQQAGSPDALVMNAAQEMIAGEPMTAEQERQARDAGWPRAGQ